MIETVVGVFYVLGTFVLTMICLICIIISVYEMNSNGDRDERITRRDSDSIK
jgi:cbb3-type cytochrome oxidase subunit 3